MSELLVPALTVTRCLFGGGKAVPPSCIVHWEQYKCQQANSQRRPTTKTNSLRRAMGVHWRKSGYSRCPPSQHMPSCSHAAYTRPATPQLTPPPSQEYLARHAVCERLNAAIEALYDQERLPDDPVAFVAQEVLKNRPAATITNKGSR